MTAYCVNIAFSIASGNSWPTGCTGLHTSVFVDDVLTPVTFNPRPFQGNVLEGFVQANSGQVISASLFDTRSFSVGSDTSVNVCMHIVDGGWANPSEPCQEGVYVASNYRWAHQAVKLA